MDERQPMSTGRAIATAVVTVAALLVVFALISNSLSSDATELDAPQPESVANPTGSTVASTTAAPVIEEPPQLGEAAELVALDGWLQSDVGSLEELRGQVVIVQFWTFGCINCKNTLSHLGALYDRYHEEGLEIVGVHTPEFEYEKDPDSIQAAAADLGVVWPIALDTEKRNFRAWQGSPAYWPRTYVLDKEGQVRYDHIGEGAYDRLADTVAHLLTDA